MSVSPTQGASGSDTGYVPQPSSQPNAGSNVTKNMFLQLMVAQLKNQDPMNPSDSTAFVGQLAQFQQLEQSLNSAQDTAAIRSDMDKLVAATVPSTTSGS